MRSENQEWSHQVTYTYTRLRVSASFCTREFPDKLSTSYHNHNSHIIHHHSRFTNLTRTTDLPAVLVLSHSDQSDGAWKASQAALSKTTQGQLSLFVWSGIDLLRYEHPPRPPTCEVAML